MLRDFCDATGKPAECFKVQERAKDIFEKSGKTIVAKEIIYAAVNVIDGFMQVNGGD